MPRTRPQCLALAARLLGAIAFAPGVAAQPAAGPHDPTRSMECLYNRYQQHHESAWCPTCAGIDHRDPLETLREPHADRLAFLPRDDITVPIAFHVFDGGPERPDTEARLARLLADLNAAFEGQGLQFCAPGPTRSIHNYGFYNIYAPAQLDALRADNRVPGAINIYFVALMDMPSLIALDATHSFHPGPQGIVLPIIVQCEDAWRSAAAHAIGHYFDLLHNSPSRHGEIDAPRAPSIVSWQSAQAGSPFRYRGPPPPPDANIMGAPRDILRMEITPEQTRRMIAALFHRRADLLRNTCPGVRNPCSPADIASDTADAPDGALTLADLSRFLALWAHGDPRADITLERACYIAPRGGDGVTISDMLCYLAAWSDGCF